MGFFNTSKKVGKVFFNFQVGRWLGFSSIKANAGHITKSAKRLVTPETSDRVETFTEAKQRLGLTDADIKKRSNEFKKLFIFFLVLASLIFGYSVFIAINGNIYGFIMGLSVTLYSLAQSFKYHFWVFQIKHKKLGCSLKEWFNAHIK